MSRGNINYFTARRLSDPLNRVKSPRTKEAPDSRNLSVRLVVIILYMNHRLTTLPGRWLSAATRGRGRYNIRVYIVIVIRSPINFSVQRFGRQIRYRPIGISAYSRHAINARRGCRANCPESCRRTRMSQSTGPLLFDNILLKIYKKL